MLHSLQFIKYEPHKLFVCEWGMTATFKCYNQLNAVNGNFPIIIKNLTTYVLNFSKGQMYLVTQATECLDFVTENVTPTFSKQVTFQRVFTLKIERLNDISLKVHSLGWQGCSFVFAGSSLLKISSIIKLFEPRHFSRGTGCLKADTRGQVDK